MYGLKKDIDLSFLNGREVIQVAIGIHQVQFGFDEDVRISVEGGFCYSDGLEASVRSYVAGNTRIPRNFAASQLANLAGRTAATRLPFVRPWADRIGVLAEQASDLATKANEVCQ